MLGGAKHNIPAAQLAPRDAVGWRNRGLGFRGFGAYFALVRDEVHDMNA